MNEEIDLIEIIRVLWKRKWLIIVPTIVVVLGLFLYFKLSPEKMTVESKIYTRELLPIIQKVEDKNENFTILDYNKYITPMMIKCKIRIGSQENRRNLSLAQRIVYSIVVYNEYEKIERGKVKKLFLDCIDDFFKKLDEKVFFEFKDRIVLEKSELESNISDMVRKIGQIDKKLVKLKEKYLKNTKREYIGIINENLEYLPPWQQYTGLSIQRDQIVLNLNILKEKLSEIKTILKEIKNNNIESFFVLVKNDKVRTCKYYYPDIKLKSEILKVLKADAIDNITLKNNNKSGIKIMLLSFFLSLFFFMFFALIVDWFYVNKPNNKQI